MPAAVKRRPGRPKSPENTSRRREEILDEASHQFAGRGFAGTDVQAVADRLGVGKGTVYRYFQTKESLFLAAVDRGMRHLREAIDAQVAEVADPLGRIERAVLAYLTFFGAHPELSELLIQERAVFKDRKEPTYFQHRRQNVREWENLLRGLIGERRIREVPVERITDVIGSVVYGTMFMNYFAGQRKPFEDQARDILDIIFRGILSDSERQGRRSRLRAGQGAAS